MKLAVPSDETILIHQGSKFSP